MSSGKKFSECIWCIHYKALDTENPCNICECNEEELFPSNPSQFKTFTEAMAKGTTEEYESIRNMLHEYYGKLSSLGHVNALSAIELREAMDKEDNIGQR